MKSTPRLSGPVLAFGFVCFAICALIGWYALKERKHSAIDDSQQAVIAAVTAETSSATDTNLAEPVAEYDLSQGIPPVIPVSLAPFLVELENDVWKTKQWSNYPHTPQKYGGVDFNIEGVIQLESSGSVQGKRLYRKSVVVPLTITNATENEVTVTDIGTNVGCIYLLGATRFSGEALPGTKIAEVIWHYANGQQRRTPIEYAVHARDWRRSRYESPDHLPHPVSKVVWREDGRSESDRNARLYRFALANPDPARVVKSIEFATAGANPSLFFIALTIDPLRLGQRPDDSEDLEEVDPPPAGQIQVVVLTPEGLPLAGARVRAFFLQKKDGSPKYVNKSLATDTNGMIMVTFPETMPERLDLSAWGDDVEYGGRKMVWDTTTGDIIPASYTFKLGEGISIGGIVVDEADQPVVGAKLSFYRFWNSNEESNKKGEQADYPNRTVTTDESGKWQAKGLPPEMLDRIGFNIKHSDFVEFSLHIGENEVEQAKFRAGTHKIVLKRGLIVRGRVTDESDNPIKDAQVWAGKQYYSGTQDTKTDAKGEFSFRNLKEDVIQFSALAKGLKPETKSITVKPGMAEIVFKLGKGSVIRGVVRNEAGEAISGVRLSLNGRMNDGSQAFQFEMKSDKDGRFEWDGAPDEPQQFSIYKEGYESKGGQTLKVAEENVVTLRKGRKVQGWVVDAETEKPITKFRVGVGHSYEFGDSGRFNANPGMKEVSDPNGVFTLTVSDEQSNAVQGESDDYAAKIEKLPAAEDGVVKVTLRLKSSPALRGILVDSQGAPVAGGTVALTKGDSMGGSVMLQNGRLNSWGQGGKVVTTDASGNFKLQSPPESGGIVVGAAVAGFSSAPVDQVRSSGRLMLQGFGRIEGTIKVAGVPTAGQQFSFSIANIGVSYQMNGFATSDEQGKFTIEKLPAGEGSVIRLIKMTENSWMHSHNTSVTIEPSKTTQVSFGEYGAVIKGRVHLETQPAEGEKLTFNASLNTKTEFNRSFATPEEATAYYKSDAWKGEMNRIKNYGVTIGADGTFSADSIPPGEYTLNVSANKPGEDRWNNKPVATGTTTVTVPENSTPYSPVFVPDIFLKPVQKP